MNFGIKPLDYLGGVPVGITDIFGEASTGKTTLGACLLRQASARGSPCVLITADPTRYAGIPNINLVQGVSTWSSLANIVGNLPVDNLLIVVDRPLESSKNAAKGLAEQDYQEGYKEIVDALVFMKTRLLKQHGSLVLLSEARQEGNHIRSALGQADRELDAQICLKQISSTETYGVTTHRKVLFRVCRNRHHPPGGCWEFVLHRTGIDPGLEHLRYLIERGEATPMGSSWKLENGTKLGPGYLAAAKQLLVISQTKDYNEKGNG